jgi:RNase P/RNase MRP subunit POP5
MVINKKLKLKPSARDNRRYMLIQCNNPKQIEQAILDYIGILGLAKSAYLIVDQKEDRIIGSCLRESLNLVLASLAFFNLNVTRVSGTIKGLRAK